MLIRKIVIGADYKSNGMHYVVGQQVLGGNYKLHEIRGNIDGSYDLFVIRGEEGAGEIIKWKTFNKNMPITVEYNLDFE